MNQTKTFKEILDSGQPLIYKIKGKSMNPLLYENRDLVKIIPKTDKALKINDVVLYINQQGQYILHRIIRKRKNGYLVYGDHNLYGESVLDNQIIGILSEIKRKDKDFTVDNPIYKAYVLIWCNILFPFRVVFGKIYVRLKMKLK